MKEILKSLNLSDYYEHTSHIISKLSGLPPPTISRDAEETIRSMFKQMQPVYRKYVPPDRINLFSYSYFLHKACELLELDELLQYFPLLKSPEKLRIQDKIWKNVCRDLKWQFIPSL